MKPKEAAPHWKTSKRESAVQLYLSSADDGAAELAIGKASGFPITLTVLPTADVINADELFGAKVAVVEVDGENADSVDRFQALAKAVKVPLFAASYDPPLALVRKLLHSGAVDVIPLPLSMDELDAAIASLGDAATERSATATQAPQPAKLVTFIKSVGGVGATALLTQLAIRFAQNEAAHGRDVCLIDLDVQFGDVAFQLGLKPRFSLTDLVDAGTRLDGHLLRATTIEHGSGLDVIAAPSDMMPIESLPGDHLLEIVDVAAREFGTLFVDLPSNWTNWSLSLVARSDLVLLITDLRVASLNRARRQLDLLKSQDLGDVEIRVVVNRYDKGMARTVSLADARKALGREIAFTIANDFPLMRMAIDRGIPIQEIRRKTQLSRDLDLLDDGIAAALQLDR